MQIDDKVSRAVIGHEGATLINLKLSTPTLELGVNAPGLLFTNLELRTSLHLQDGCDSDALYRFIDGITVTAYCGHSSPIEVDLLLAGESIAPFVSMNVGPPSMYMSHLIFETKQEETLAELCNRVLNQFGRTEYMVALAPILNQNMEHGGNHSTHHEITTFTNELNETDGLLRRKRRIEYVLPETRRPR